MKIELERITRNDSYTSGRLYVDGIYVCDTLEDKDRDDNRNGIFDGGETKVYARTAIPNGTYEITLEHSPKFSPRYGGRKVPRLHDVPRHTYTHGQHRQRHVGLHLGGKQRRTGPYREQPRCIRSATTYAGEGRS